MNPSTSKAVLGGGCFWCLEAAFTKLRGVFSAFPGYCGGHILHPTYQQVCSGETGHAEVVEIQFDPDQISFEQLLQVFFQIHDPTQKDRQGNDIGTQYRSVVICQSDEQYQTTLSMIKAMESKEVFAAPIQTQVLEAMPFFAAEPEHRDYFEKHPEQAYCAAVVAPKIQKFQHRFIDLLKSEFIT